MSDKKYEFTGETNVVAGFTLQRIRALRDFGLVKKGELGGWLASEANLSHAGNAWVSGNAAVYGNARVYDNARVWGEALVYEDAQVFGCAEVWGNAQVYGDSRVYGDAWVSGDARVRAQLHLVEGNFNGRPLFTRLFWR